MATFKFKTKISKEGTIEVPHRTELHNQEVEVTLRIKEFDDNNQINAYRFLDKWTGFLKHSKDDIHDNAKYEYLMNKYR